MNRVTHIRTKAVVLIAGIALYVAAAFAATQNYLPKYNSGGVLIDSAIYESSGSVGIGTVTPSTTLEVVGSIMSAGVINLSAGTQGALTLIGSSSTSPISGRLTYGTDGSGWQFRIAKNQSGTITDQLTILDSGNVGIGTTSPSSKLSVSGDVTVSGNIAAKYQDVAEWVPAREALSSGTVVVISADESNVVLQSNGGYQAGVAGVVSAQPGVTLGEKRPGSLLVSHTGRVRVKADAGYGAIHRGDLLVTSPTPGFAMKSEAVRIGGIDIHRPGTVLGKALEPLTDGQGEILTLITLQ